jgi:PmbA protein
VKELVAIALNSAKSAGCDEVEVVGTQSKEIEVKIDSQIIHDIKVIEDIGIGVRAYYDRGMGFSYTMQIDKDKIHDTAIRAVQLAKCASPDPNFFELPTPQSANPVGELFDERIANISVDKLASMGEEIIENALKVNNNVSLEGELYVLIREKTIINSRGIEFSGKDTVISSWIVGIIKQSEANVGCGREFSIARNMDDFDFLNIGKEASKKALRMLSAKQLPTKITTFFLSPLATRELVWALEMGLNAYEIIYGRSFFTDKMEKQITSEKITIVDDGRIEGGVFSSPVDGEGVPKHKFTIIKNGILKTYLHNSNTAKKMGVKNNACAVRRSYKSPPGIGLSNVQFTLGERNFKSIISEIEDGIYVDNFPWPNPITGDISSMIDFGIEIKNGELKDPVKNTMIGTNFRDILLNIDEVSKDKRDIGGSIFPYLRIRNIQIAGR